jgi:hypothetical protein
MADPRWNLVQVIGWVAFRDPGVVGHFSPRRIGAPPPTLHALYTSAALREGVDLGLTIDRGGQAVPLRGSATNWKISDACGDLITQLSGGRLTAIGLRKGTGDPKAVPPTHWSYLEFRDDPLGAAAKKPDRKRAANWIDLTFDRDEVLAVWPAADLPDPYRSGLQGRPTIRHLILAQFRDRAEAGQCEAKLAQEARVLHRWATANHPRAPVTTPQTIENLIRNEYRVYKAARDTSNTPQN